jgi:hypothetical protein
MWRNTSELVVKQKGLTPAYAEDAMDHLITYQYWAIIMLLWTASASGSDRANPSALVIDEIISRMWGRLRLGHLAIKERVSNLVRWGFFTEQTIKKAQGSVADPHRRKRDQQLSGRDQAAVARAASGACPIFLRERRQDLLNRSPGPVVNVLDSACLYSCRVGLKI